MIDADPARERALAQLAAQYAVVEALAESETLEEATPRLLETLCGALGYVYGALWTANDDGSEFNCVATWSSSLDLYESFDEATRSAAMRVGEGLPGRVFERGEPIWVEDIVDDRSYPRSRAAERAGLHGALGFAIESSGRIYGAIEMYSDRPQLPDMELLGLLSATGKQVGRYAEHVLTRRAATRSEALKSGIIEASLDCFVAMDADGLVAEFNPTAERVFGYTREEAIGGRMADLIIPERFRDAHHAGLKRFLETGVGRIIGDRIELLAMRRDGSEFPAELTITSVDTPEAPLFAGHIRDISARKQQEAAIEYQASLLQAIDESSPDGRLAVTHEGKFISYNQRFVDMWAIPEAALAVGTNEAAIQAVLEQIINPDEFVERIRYLRANPSIDSNDEIRLKDGRIFERKGYPLGDPPEYIGRVWFFRDITEHKRAEEAERFLSEASKVLAASLDQDETLRGIARIAVPAFSEWCAIDAFDANGRRRRVALAHVDPERERFARDLERRYPPEDDPEGALFRVYRSGEAELYPSIPDELLEQSTRDEEHLRLIREVGLSSALVVPLKLRGSVIGVMSFVTSANGKRFDEGDLEVVQELARRTAGAIDNTRLYEERSHVARTLQESLLPPELPEIPGIEVSAFFRPSGDETIIGGDFYDVFQADAASWGIVLGDVCGKGPEAAALTALVRYSVRAHAVRTEDPANVLKLVNDSIIRNSEDARFSSAAYGVLRRLGDGVLTLRLASAGHPLPVLVRAGRAQPVGVPGTLLGVAGDPTVETSEVTLNSGDTLFWYTDGLTDAYAPEREISDARLATIFERTAGWPARRAIEEVRESLIDIGLGRARDDIAVLAIAIG